MNRNAKLSVAVLLSLGVVASVSACIRLRYTVKLNESEDFLFAIGDVVIWGYAENAFGVIVGCISTLRPLFVRVLNLGDPSSGKTRSGHVQLPAIAPQRGQPGHARGKESDSKGGIVKSVQLRAESGDLGSESEDELVRNIRGGYRW